MTKIAKLLKQLDTDVSNCRLVLTQNRYPGFLDSFRTPQSRYLYAFSQLHRTVDQIIEKINTISAFSKDIQLERIRKAVNVSVSFARVYLERLKSIPIPNLPGCEDYKKVNPEGHANDLIAKIQTCHENFATIFTQKAPNNFDEVKPAPLKNKFY